MNVVVCVHNQQKTLVIDSKAVQAIAQAVVEFEGQNYHEVAIFFVDTKAISDLHAQYFDDPTTTDCISFPVDDEANVTYRMLGDVFVCPETAVTYAKEHEQDPYRETTLYIVHGLLHLMGYDDQEEEDETAMRAAEARHMAMLTEKKMILLPPKK